uniref:Uncharacterized protein n=1 Tax=uncultured Armatimonadetes bacterium TaxID=157466 RepID=A0A6J4H6F1_9BACT|nr:hypothetical protein AVDCRST_MAG63-52 [uncultured Armatimonadetes bacterium]
MRRDQLAEGARAADRTSRGAQATATLIETGESDEARRHAEEATRVADYVLNLLLPEGAPPPGGNKAADTLPLHLRDTPASRRLLAAVEEAVGADVDHERGRMQDGEPCGWGETFAGLALTLRVEVEGPAGGGRD